MSADKTFYETLAVIRHANVNLTNRMWFNVVCTLIDNDIRHHSSRNVVDSRGAAEWVHNKFCPL